MNYCQILQFPGTRSSCWDPRCVRVHSQFPVTHAGIPAEFLPLSAEAPTEYCAVLGSCWDLARIRWKFFSHLALIQKLNCICNTWRRFKSLYMSRTHLRFYWNCEDQKEEWQRTIPLAPIPCLVYSLCGISLEMNITNSSFFFHAFLLPHSLQPYPTFC